MSYFAILLVFVIPPIVIITVLLRKRLSKKSLQLIFVLVVIAVVYTSPWDNYLVATEVWWYDPNLVTGITLGWVPIEEYTFFVLQTVMTSLVYLFFKERYGLVNAHSHNRRFGIAFFFVISLWFGSIIILVTGWQPATYLGLELVWALVPILVQLAFGADLMWANRQLVFISIFIPTIYLSSVDWLAIGIGTWTISPEKSLGIMIAGRLPIEEVIFFSLTNILVVFGMHLGLHPKSLDRIPTILKRRIGLVKSK